MACIFSSYSHFRFTRYAIYSKTSATPSPVFADVKKSLGPRSRGGSNGDGGGGESGGEWEVEEDAVTIVGIRLFEILVFEDKPFSRMHVLGVRVAVLPAVLTLLKEHVSSLRCLELDEGLIGSDEDNESRDEHAEW